ncbi:hypothetical protein [Bacillus sp. AFS031507]|uniref:hypothetical protein n=1 Tax=Bacillus sp. AFS031507 TaxID=2033496 RepID=UPI0015D47DC9|nr:hypothetical protein [Bacillus sp. AFS031507]
MEFSVLNTWLQFFLLIMGGCLILFIAMLFISNKHIKNRLKQMEEIDKNEVNITN